MEPPLISGGNSIARKYPVFKDLRGCTRAARSREAPTRLAGADDNRNSNLSNDMRHASAGRILLITSPLATVTASRTAEMPRSLP
jgi:hypothetical protein